VFETLSFEIRDRVGYVQFSTPEKLNSISEQRIVDLERLVALVREDESIRALSITGSGRAFCVGLDLGLLKRAFYDIPYFESIIRRLQKILFDLEDLPVAVIAAVNGLARAGGFELLLAADFIVMADEARIGDAHAHLGVLPGAGCSQRLPRRVGELRAKELILLARWISGPEAVAMGLALRSVPLAELPAAVEVIANEMRHRPRETTSALKREIHAARRLNLEAGIEFETQTFVEYMTQLPIGREGYEASLAGREPDWY
jgi:enoyl-CoA hydratase/carnithine racemase